MISFVVPAHNEEAMLGGTLQALREAARHHEEGYELVVVDDASTDRTAKVAADNGATVVAIDERKISAARNAGAHVANGEVIFFVDADTLVSHETVAASIQAVREGAIGGTAVQRFDRSTPFWARLVWNGMAGYLMRGGGGAFVSPHARRSTRSAALMKNTLRRRRCTSVVHYGPPGDSRLSRRQSSLRAGSFGRIRFGPSAANFRRTFGAWPRPGCLHTSGGRPRRFGTKGAERASSLGAGTGRGRVLLMEGPR